MQTKNWYQTVGTETSYGMDALWQNGAKVCYFNSLPLRVEERTVLTGSSLVPHCNAWLAA